MPDLVDNTILSALKLPLFDHEFSLSHTSQSISGLMSPFADKCSREKLKIPANVVDQLVAGAQSDIRQVLNMLSTWKLSSNSIDFDEGKALYARMLHYFPNSS